MKTPLVWAGMNHKLYTAATRSHSAKAAPFADILYIFTKLQWEHELPSDYVAMCTYVDRHFKYVQIYHCGIMIAYRMRNIQI